jgi:hypothetical protein
MTHLRRLIAIHHRYRCGQAVSMTTVCAAWGLVGLALGYGARRLR